MKEGFSLNALYLTTCRVSRFEPEVSILVLIISRFYFIMTH
jgi:hypothetical protein